jgi:hypothetical protein
VGREACNNRVAQSRGAETKVSSFWDDLSTETITGRCDGASDDRPIKSAVRTRKPVIQDAVFGHLAAAACHMTNQAYFRKATVTWDGANDTIRS